MSESTNILVVEDNHVTRKLVRVTLELEGFGVREAPDGAQAIAAVRARAPGLVLQDLMLPDMDGLELVGRLRRLLGAGRVPIVAVSGMLPRLADARRLEAGFDEFLFKPVEPSRLVGVVRSLIRPVAALPEARRGAHVLLVDDDPIQLRFQRARLETLGFDVAAAADAETALETARRRVPDIIVCDVLMPGRSGIDLCLAVRRDPRLAGVPIVLASSTFNYIEPGDRELALRAGASAFVVRTPDMEEITGALLANLGRAVAPPAGGEPVLPEFARRLAHQLQHQTTLNQSLTRRLSLAEAERGLLASAAELLSGPMDAGPALREMLARALDAGGVGIGAIYLADAAGDLRLEAAMGCHDDDLPGSLFGQRGLLERVTREREAVVVPSPGVPAGVADALLRCTHSSGAVLLPLVAGGDSLGVMAMFASAQIVEDSWLAAMRALAAQVAQAVARARAAASLAESEHRYRALFERNPQAILLVEPASRRILAANEPAGAQYKYARAELERLTLDDLAAAPPPAGAPRPPAAEVGLERHRTRDGAAMDVEVRRSVVDLKGQRAWLLQIRDVTEKLRQERREDVQHAVTGVLAGSDTIADAAAGLLAALGRGGCWELARFWSVQEGGRLRQLSEWIGGAPAADAPEWLEPGSLDPRDPLVLAREGGLPVWTPVEAKGSRAPWRSGFLTCCAVPIENGGEGAGMIELLGREARRVEPDELTALAALGREIGHFASRRAAEAASRESLSLLEAVTEGTSDAVYIYDLEGRYRMFNSAAAAMMGRTRADVLGRTQRELFSAAAARTLERTTAEVLASGTPHVFEFDLVVGGEPRTYQSSHSVWRDAAGRAIGVCGIARDVTEHKRLEAQFLQSQRLEAVGRLAGGVAHDFNNLLTVMLGYTSIVAADLGADHPLGRAVGEIARAGERAAQLTRQLLAFGRQQVFRSRPLDVNEVVGSVETMVRPLIGEDVEVAVRRAPGLWTVQADPGQLEQVILNLVVNARDAMPDGGRLTLATANVHLEAAITGAVEPVAAGWYVTLTVADTGTGMDDATRARIFEPFFTTKEQGKGTGLGLSTVFGIVKQSGGSLAVETAPGRGATFTVYLPRVDATPEAARPPATPDLRGGSEVILLIEDEGAVRRLERQMLEGLGYQVREAGRPEQALAILERDPGAIRLVVSDVTMPGMSGPEVVARLRRLDSGLRVLYVSGYASGVPGADDPLRLADPVLPKPFTLPTLARKVREVLDEAA